MVNRMLPSTTRSYEAYNFDILRYGAEAIRHTTSTFYVTVAYFHAYEIHKESYTAMQYNKLLLPQHPKESEINGTPKQWH